jgi:hypothetical protein
MIADFTGFIVTSHCKCFLEIWKLVSETVPDFLKPPLNNLRKTRKCSETATAV